MGKIIASAFIKWARSEAPHSSLGPDYVYVYPSFVFHFAILRFSIFVNIAFYILSYAKPYAQLEDQLTTSKLDGGLKYRPLWFCVENTTKDI